MFNICTRKLAAVICTLAMMSTCILPAFAASSFPDVPSSHWSYPYVSAAVEEGLVRGFPDGKFHPNDEVTYAQFITIVAQAYYVIPKGTASTPWYQVYVDALNQDNLLAGTAAGPPSGSPSAGMRWRRSPAMSLLTPILRPGRSSFKRRRPNLPTGGPSRSSTRRR